MSKKILIILAMLSMILFSYELIVFPLITLKTTAFILISALLAYLVLAGFRLISRSALSELSLKEARKLICKTSGLSRFSVCLSGIDGSGKTSQASELARYLRNLGFKVNLVWGRWPAFTCYLVLGVGKLFGFHIKIKDPSGRTRIIPHYHALGILAKLYIFFMLLDIYLWYVRVKITNFRKNVIIFDRFILDVFTDLACETGEQFVKEFGFLARIYIASARKLNLLIILDLDPRLAYKRKVDVSLRELQIKRKLFSLIALRSSAYLLDASNPADQVASQVKRIFRERIESPVGYARPRQKSERWL